MPSRKPLATEAPHSWDMEHWPEHVWPHTRDRARYVVRLYRDDLVREGALSRVGRELVFFGARYSRWLEKRAALVPDFEIAANRKHETAEATQG